MIGKKRLNSVLIKPSGPDCNLKCTYCFYLEKADIFRETTRHRMSDEVLERLIKQLATQASNPFNMVWQGGEPTLMGLDFYKKAADLQKKFFRPKSYTNGFQTNGVLLNEEWADFFKKEDWLIGLSIDGPAFIHDEYRVDLGNKPSHTKIEAKAKMLIERDVKVNAMCCITSLSAQYPDEIYNYYKNLGMYFMQFIPIVETDKNDPSKAADFSVTPEQYGNFLKRIFDLWYEDFRKGTNTIFVRDIESVFFNYLGMNSPECVFNEECGGYLVVEYNGNAYSCDFYVEPEWELGNITSGRMIEFLNSELQTKFGKMKNDLPQECYDCEFYDKCYGGCPKDRVKDPRDQGKPRFCQSYKMFFGHADARLKKIAENWKKQHGMPNPNTKSDTLIL